MKIGVFANALADLSLEEALAVISELGAEAAELACGGLSGVQHVDASALLNDGAALSEFQKIIEKSGLDPAALTCHANPVHPHAPTAAMYDKALRDAVTLAERIGVEKVVTFSGCPGSRGSIYPTWPTAVWPYDNVALIKYQWEEVLIPYWKEMATFAAGRHVKIAIEMYPGFTVFQPRGIIRLREVCGEAIGAAVDPGNLIWQGMDVAAVIRLLGDAVYHFHAKDCSVNKEIMGRVGFFDPFTSPVGSEHPFRFCIPGNGSDAVVWKQMVTALRDAGYDGVLSVEHEDAALGQREGLKKSIDFLSGIVLRETETGCRWYDAVTEQEKKFLPKREV
jgi:sugar phosphate isomerase/epimerase